MTETAISFDVWKPNSNLGQGRLDPARCAASVYRPPSWFPGQCAHRGVLEYGGHLWCKLHHPPAKKAKGEAKQAAWEADRRMRDARLDAAQAERNLKDAALKALQQIADGHNDPRGLAMEVLGKAPSHG